MRCRFLLSFLLLVAPLVQVQIKIAGHPERSAFTTVVTRQQIETRQDAAINALRWRLLGPFRGGRPVAGRLDDPVDELTLRTLLTLQPEGLEPGEKRHIICLDHAFRGNDSLRANLVQQVKQHNTHHPEHLVELRTVRT